MPVLPQLNTLETTGLIHLATVQPELEYLFRHALVQDAAYGSLLKSDRRKLHQMVGETLESLYPDQRDELAATLAYHFEKAEVPDKAIYYFDRAGERANESFANAEALAFYQAALGQAEQLGKQRADAATKNQLAALCEKRADVHERLGQHETAREYYYRASELLAELPHPDKVMQARLYRKIGATHTLQRQYVDTIQVWERAESLLGELTELRPSPAWNEWMELQSERVMYHYWRNESAEMKKICDRFLPVVEQIGTQFQRANALYNYNLYLFREQRYVVSDEIMDDARHNLHIAIETGKLGIIFDFHFVGGFFTLLRRELDEAERYLQHCFDLAQRMGDPVRISRAANYLMFVARMRGQMDVTESYFDIVLSTTWAGPMADYTFTVRACQAWIAWRKGKLTEARSYGMEARETVVGPFSHYPFQWFVYFPLIGIAVAEGNLVEAADYARIILNSAQMGLPEDLTVTLEKAVQCVEQNDLIAARVALEAAIKIATGYGYL